MTFYGGLYPLFCLFYDQQRELVFAIQKFFLFHLFKYPFALSAIRLFSGTWVGLFQPSVCSGDLSVAISLSSNLELEPTSTSATCLHGSYFMSTRKTAFWIQERILFQFLKKAQLVLLSVYPTYPFTFYVNRTKRHVTWSICLRTLLFITISVLKLSLLYIYNLLLVALLQFTVKHKRFDDIQRWNLSLPSLTAAV